MGNFDRLDLSEHINHLNGVLCHPSFPSGTLAALRRMTPGQSPPLAFLRFATEHLDPDSLSDPWITIVAGMARMAPQAHDPRCTFGSVLARARFSESRLAQFLDSQGLIQQRFLLRIARFFAAQGQAFNWHQVATLLLVSDVSRHAKIRQDIATQYYRALPPQ
ncbi:MAG: type I-E CRISPR-associated protein Cse2/CasB [Sulfobacillus sp.]